MFKTFFPSSVPIMTIETIVQTRPGNFIHDINELHENFMFVFTFLVYNTKVHKHESTRP